MVYESLAGDKLQVHPSPLGLGLLIVPATPPFEPNVMDMFQLGMSFSTLARFRASLRERGAFTTDDRQTHVRLEGGQLSFSFLSKHLPDRRFTAVFDQRVEAELMKQVDELLGSHPQAAEPKRMPISRNAECPCGSGRKYKRCCLAKDAAKDAAEAPVPSSAKARRGVVDLIVNSVGLPRLRDFGRAARLQPAVLDDARFWDELGMELGSNGYFAEARRAQEIGLSIAPSDAPLLCNIAVSEAELGDVESGLARLEAVPQDAPQSAVIRANLLKAIGRIEEAVPYYEQAIQEEPNFDLPYLNLIEILEGLGSPQVEYWLRRAVEHLKDSPEVATKWAEYLFRQDRLEELADANWIDSLRSRAGDSRMIGQRAGDARQIVAAQLWRACAVLQQEPTAAWLDKAVKLGVAHREVGGDCEPLLLLFSLAVQNGAPVVLDRVFPLICDQCRTNRLLAPLPVFRAQAFMVVGEWAHARDEAQRALEQAPEHPGALHVLWWSLDELGERREALAVAERYAAVTPDDAHIEYNMGFLAGRLGEHGRAAYHYERQVERDPDHPYAEENLAVTLVLECQFERAEKTFARAMARRRQRFAEAYGLAETSFEAEAVHFEDEDGKEIDPVEVFAARERSFDALLAFARSRVGTPTYTRDVVACREGLNPPVGSHVAVPQSVLTTDSMLGELHQLNEVRRAELIAAMQREGRGDRSALVVELERHLRWEDLTDAARETLLEAEARFRDGRSLDYAPNVVSYAKAVEVTLLASVFQPLREGITPPVRQRMAGERRTGQADVLLRRFLVEGRAITLGDMMHALRRAAGPSTMWPELDPSALLRRHLIMEERLTLLEPAFVDAGIELTRHRNAAAHATTFDRTRCAEVRSSAMALLARVLGGALARS